MLYTWAVPLVVDLLVGDGDLEDHLCPRRHLPEDLREGPRRDAPVHVVARVPNLGCENTMGSTFRDMTWRALGIPSLLFTPALPSTHHGERLSTPGLSIGKDRPCSVT